MLSPGSPLESDSMASSQKQAAFKNSFLLTIEMVYLFICTHVHTQASPSPLTLSSTNSPATLSTSPTCFTFPVTPSPDSVHHPLSSIATPYYCYLLFLPSPTFPSLSPSGIHPSSSLRKELRVQPWTLSHNSFSLKAWRRESAAAQGGQALREGYHSLHL